MSDKLDFSYPERFLEYHAHMGLFTWSVARGRRFRVGDLAGTSRAQYQQFPIISVDGTQYPADRLAWWMARGERVDEPLIPINGDYDDVRIENLRKRG
jgi:hypothetical protein